MRSFVKYFASLLLIFAPLLSRSQQRYNVFTQGIETLPSKFKQFDKNTSLDSFTIITKSHALINALRVDGYVFANLDSLRFSKDICNLYFFIGNKYSSSTTNFDLETKKILDLSGASFTFKSFPDSTTLNRQINASLDYLNNIGHPFAALEFKKIKIEENKVSSILHINKGPLIIYDTLNIIGNTNLNRLFLQKYLEIAPGKVYDHKKVSNLSKKLNDLPFVAFDTFPTVSFINEKAMVRLFLKERTASRFDFIVGALPGTENGERSFKFNVDFSADLINKLGRGENLQLKFQRLKADDVQAFIAANYPYILGTSFGVDGSFELLQNNGRSTDATFLIGMQYLFTGNNILKFSYNNKSSRLSNLDLDAIKNIGKLPTSLDFSYNGLTTALQYRNLDYRFNPTKGYEFNTRVNFGARSILKNISILELKSDQTDFSSAYDTLKNIDLQASLTFDFANYVPIKRWATIKTALIGAYRYTDGLILDNEVYRIGGNRLVRGFDELSIITDSYLLFTSEFRVLLEKNSFLSLPFIDIARTRIIKDGKKEWRNAIGLGIGINFSTRAGIFNFSFAAGNNLQGSPDFGNTKIHFGYLNLF